MFAILAHIRPLDPRTNKRVDVRVASTPSPAAQGLGGAVWESAISRRPRASIELFGLDLAPGTRTATADMEISLAAVHEVDVSALVWSGAPFKIYRADDLAWPATVEFDGYVSNAKPNLETEVISLTAKVSTAMLEKPLLTGEFTGGGGLEGAADKRSVLKPAGFGICLNIEPVLFDTVRNVYMLDGYGNLLSVEWMGEGLSSLGASVGDFPTYAKLCEAIDVGAVPPGRWATSIADGVVGLGAPPVGVITCHATFGYGMTGALIRRAVITHAGVPANRTVDSSFDALDADVPYPIHYWTGSQVQVKDLIESLAAGCNASPVVTFQGKLGIVRPFGGPRMGVIRRQGLSEPAVTDWATNDAIAPYWKVTARAARPVRVMTFDEINFVDDIEDRGLYSPTTTYRAGNVVWLRNKSQWLYVSDVPDKGHAPPDPLPEGQTGDAYWQLLAPAPDASDLTYQDGTPIEDLQPDEAGAQISRTLTLSESTVAFTLDREGNPVAGQFPYTFKGSVSAANYDVTATAHWSIVATAGITAEIDDDEGSPTRGQVRIFGITKAGTITVQAISGNVTLKQTLTVTTKGILADQSEVNTGLIAIGAVTGSISFIGQDVPIEATEATLIETPMFAIGDDKYGTGIFIVSFNQDSVQQVDTGCAIRTYVDSGTGYQQVIPMKPQGIRTENGNTYWAMNAAYAFSVTSQTPIRVKVTVQGVQIGGSGKTGGSTARSPRIDLFTGER